MGDNVILKKTFALAVESIKIGRELQTEKKEYIVSKQLMRSSTSVGAMVREAQQAESKADFIHKMAIALKEANETEYWIELLEATDLIEGINIVPITASLKESVKMLTSIVKTAKSNLKNRN
jgi:four helix bundle protein